MRTLLVAGGSGGHLIPALTLAEHLRKRGPCFFLSTRRPMDRTLASMTTADSGKSLEWIALDLEHLTPVWRWATPRYVLRQMKAWRRLRKILRRVRPDVVIGFGGYLSAVGLAAARLERVPTVIHEQNVLPGRANRWLSPWADAVAVSFPETAGLLSKRAVVEVTGNPVRPHLKKVSLGQARSHFGFDLNRPVLLITGGSQGSEAINSAVLRMWERVPPRERRRLQVIHLTGLGKPAPIRRAYRRFQMDAAVHPFLHEMEFAYAAATLALSRAGATAIAEMVDLQLPAILVPYPHAGGHQRANARWMASFGGAVVLEEKELSSERLWEELQEFLWDPERLAYMRVALQSKSDGSALDRLEALVERVAR